MSGNAYVPVPPSGREDPATYAFNELQDLAQALSGSQEFSLLQVLHVEPDKPRDGMIIVADGTDWNPGSGEGPYAYVGGSWLFMGGGGGGGGNVATDTIWNAKGDLAVGTGADTASRLAVGTDGYVLTADSTTATGLKWAASSGSGGSGNTYFPGGW
jgi:hypothetical protein